MSEESVAEAPLGADAIDQVTDEEALAAGPVQVQIPMQNIVLSGADVRVVRNDETNERVVLVGPIAFQFALPFPEENARVIARELSGGILPVSSISPADIAAAKKLGVGR